MAMISGTVNVGTVGVVCPVCDAEIPVTVTATLGRPEEAHAGTATLICEPDMTDLWAHMWSHDV